MSACICVCVCACVRVNERGREREGGRGRESEQAQVGPQICSSCIFSADFSLLFSNNYYYYSFLPLYRDPAQPSSVLSARDEYVRTDPHRSLRHAAATTTTPWYGGNADGPRHDECSKTWHGPPTTNAPWIWGVLADTIAHTACVLETPTIIVQSL